MIFDAILFERPLSAANIINQFSICNNESGIFFTERTCQLKNSLKDFKGGIDKKPVRELFMPYLHYLL